MTDTQVVEQQANNSLVDNTNTSLDKSGSVANTNVANLSEQERIALRAKKFGAQTENSKKELRAQRFGAPATGGGGGDASALEKRAQRFGTAADAPAAGGGGGGVDKELLEKRAKRFGIEAGQESNGTNGSKPTDEVLAKRKERFGEVSQDDAKKKLRQQRFQAQA